VKPRLVPLLECPGCHSDLELAAAQSDSGEVMEGALACTGCRVEYPIRRGVPRFTDTDSRGHEDTAAAFGYQWKSFAALDPRYRTQFLDWVRPVQPADFVGKRVLEGGCGKGRHTALAADFGAADVVSLDLSDAVDVAFANAGRHPAVHVVQADLNRPPVRPVFDYAFSVGVLHHMPDPEAGFRALVARLRPGGAISAWVYGRENNGWIVHVISPLRERVTSKLPRPLLHPIAGALTVPLFAATRLIYRPLKGSALASLLPYRDYLQYIADFPFREHRTIVFDHLVAPVAYYLTEREFSDWFVHARLEDIRIEHHNANSWRGFGRTKESL
jgi:SAM-dependent methyltransferase